MTGFLIPTFMIMIGAVEDLRARRIANWINVSLLFFGFTFQFYNHGLTGLLNAGLAVVVALILCSLLFIFKVFGGGDLKLLVAVSAAIGTIPFLYLTALSVLWGAVFGLIHTLLTQSVTRLGSNLFTILLLRKNIPNQNLNRIPFTIPILFAWLTYWSLTNYGVI